MALQLWFQKMEEHETPLFRQTSLDVAEIAADPESGSDRLSHLILRDPLLVARILRMANTAFYNPSGKPIQTIPRAILLLGLERIRTLCLSAILVETLQSGKWLHRIQHELGRSIHAGLLARAIGQQTGEGALDEIFLAGLMRHIGTILFWSVGGEDASHLDQALKDSDQDTALEKAVLGFQLKDLTNMVCEQWKLSRLLVDMSSAESLTGPMLCVVHGWSLALALEDGWGSESARDGLAKVSGYLDVDCAQAALLMAKVTREAHLWATEMGAEEVCSSIPDPPEEGSEVDSLFMDQELSPPPAGDAPRIPQIARVIEELSLLRDPTDFHKIPEVVLRGLVEGLGMDRALFAAHVPTAGELRCRIVHGASTEGLQERWRFVPRFQLADSLSRALETGSPIAHDPGDPSRQISLPETLEPYLKDAAFLFLPVSAQGRILGAFCADRASSRRGLDPTTVEGFQMIRKGVEDAIARTRS